MMSRIAPAVIAVLAVLVSVPSESKAQAALEALKAGSMPSAILSAAPAVPAPAVGRAAQISTYDGGEYRSQWDARTALTNAEASLRQAGFAVLGGRVVPPEAGRTGYSLHIDYQDGQAGPTQPARTIETYKSGEFAQNYQASQELNNSVSSLANAGYTVLRAQVVQRQGKWLYEVDYVQGRQAPARHVRLFTSGYYLPAYLGLAQRDMTVAIYNLQVQGAAILAYGIFPVPGTFYWVYQIRFLTR